MKNEIGRFADNDYAASSLSVEDVLDNMESIGFKNTKKCSVRLIEQAVNALNLLTEDELNATLECIRVETLEAIKKSIENCGNPE